jgi:phosphoglycerate dehydrogenase-like enzyme
VAGLDVFDPESVPPDSEILGLPNVFLSPYIAGVTAQSYPRFFKLMVDELDRFFHGHETLRSDTAVSGQSAGQRSGGGRDPDCARELGMR